MADLFPGTQVHMVEFMFKIKVRLMIQSPAIHILKSKAQPNIEEEVYNPNAMSLRQEDHESQLRPLKIKSDITTNYSWDKFQNLQKIKLCTYS